MLSCCHLHECNPPCNKNESHRRDKDCQNPSSSRSSKHHCDNVEDCERETSRQEKIASVAVGCRGLLSDTLKRSFSFGKGLRARRRTNDPPAGRLSDTRGAECATAMNTSANCVRLVVLKAFHAWRVKRPNDSISATAGQKPSSMNEKPRPPFGAALGCSSEKKTDVIRVSQSELITAIGQDLLTREITQTPNMLIALVKHDACDDRFAPYPVCHSIA
ncbi:MAG: hypothetical protein QOF48_363 [Verrucomicrobiota bacterium]